MAIKSVELSLSTSACCAAGPQTVCGRQGDEGTALAVTVTGADGAPVDLSGASAALMGNNPHLLKVAGTVSGSTATFELPSAFFARAGAFKLYVELSKGGETASTQDFMLRVLPGADLSSGQAGHYVPVLDGLAERAESLADELEGVIGSADITVGEVETLDPGSRATAELRGEGLRKVLDLGIPGTLGSDGVSCSQGPADVVTVGGAAEDAPLLGATVWGETRQNLFPKITSGASSGAFFDVQDDGAVKISGTVADGVYAARSAKTNILQSGKTYTLSNPGGSGSAYAQVQYVTGGTLTYQAVYAEKTVTFTVPADVTDVVAGVVLLGTGEQLESMCRPMLNEGSTAAPWCPPGLSSVADAELVACGRNLLRYLPDRKPESSSGVTLTPQGDGGFKVRGTAAKTVYFNLDFVTDYGSATTDAKPFAGMQMTASKKGGEGVGFSVSVFTDTGTGWKNFLSTTAAGTSEVPDDATAFRSFVSVAAGATVDTVIYPQLELGAQATQYKPPAAASADLPLDGVGLHSLPDGTRDELRVGIDGIAELVQRVGAVVLDGGETWYQGNVETAKNVYYTAYSASTFDRSKSGSIMCDSLNTGPYTYDDGMQVNSPYTLGMYSGVTASHDYLGFRAPDGMVDAEQVKAFFASNPTTVLYALATPKVTVLGKVTLPRSQGDPTHVWCASPTVPAQVSADALLHGGRALGKVIDWVSDIAGALPAVTE